ncbi:MAG TPA: tetratricopeptide repeat protein [Rhodopila sp.]|nr:tetratricopeptide repeat protein [Rhodopila sp.]
MTGHTDTSTTLGYAQGLLEVAFAAVASGHHAEAAALVRMLIGQLGPREADALLLLGQQQRRIGDLAGAEWLLRQAVAVNPMQADALMDLGETLRLAGKPRQAVPFLERAAALVPDAPGLRASLAASYTALENHQEALRWARAELAANPNQPAAHGLMGDVLARLGRAQEAITEYDKALALRPEESRARYGRALARLELGDMPGAWRDHEARLDILGTAPFTQPAWHGQKRIKRRRILLYAEQGYADTVQFVRYATLVATTGATVLLRVQPDLGRLCATVPGVSAASELADPVPAFDLHCPLLSLPAIFATSLKTIPHAVPYLTADDFVRGQWRQALKPWRKMRVGLAWRGAASMLSASIPPGALAPLLARTDIECHTLQRVASNEEQATFAQAADMADHSLGLTHVDQIAGLIAEMDLVIAVDSVEAHLAGALGVAAWVMLPHPANWRWLREREDSPWYPTMRLFRQRHPGDWHSVIEQVMHNLDAWAVQRA